MGSWTLPELGRAVCIWDMMKVIFLFLFYFINFPKLIPHSHWIKTLCKWMVHIVTPEGTIIHGSDVNPYMLLILDIQHRKLCHEIIKANFRFSYPIVNMLQFRLHCIHSIYRNFSFGEPFCFYNICGFGNYIFHGACLRSVHSTVHNKQLERENRLERCRRYYLYEPSQTFLSTIFYQPYLFQETHQPPPK